MAEPAEQEPPAIDPPVETALMDRRIDAALARRSISGGSGGGGSSSLEPRLAKLEADVDHIKRDMVDVRGDLRTLRDQSNDLSTRLAVLSERVSHLPSKGFIVTATMTAMAFVTALIIAQSRLQDFFRLTR